MIRGGWGGAFLKNGQGKGIQEANSGQVADARIDLGSRLAAIANGAGFYARPDSDAGRSIPPFTRTGAIEFWVERSSAITEDAPARGVENGLPPMSLRGGFPDSRSSSGKENGKISTKQRPLKEPPRARKPLCLLSEPGGARTPDLRIKRTI